MKGAAAKPDLEAVFDDLREILRPFAKKLVVVHDDATNYYLDTAHLQANGKPLYFGSAKIGKRYVSFHLMPVYIWPELLEGTSAELRKRMQGKSCFNFRRVEPELIEELAGLTMRGFERYRGSGYVG